ncbi:MAG: 8-oxoguanine glycosylase ogg1 [Pleopsidium flavum]|nr:MAG: 8-oxoguanine glycosylase ogg1 [Pleopsidium flavum]
MAAMGHIRATEWRKLPVSLTELCINTTLRCGQTFRWRKSDDDEWSCALHGRILSLRQDTTHLHYRALFPHTLGSPPTPPSSAPPSTAESSIDYDDTDELVHHYFNLKANLTELYEQWSSADLNFKKRAPRFTGIRILKQDAWEAIVGFICSSNNNIARISQMVEKLCIHYGPLIGHIGSQPYHDLPHASALTSPSVESHLRHLGFGYRAKYLHQTAIVVATERDSGWLENLRNPDSPPLDCKATLVKEMPEGGRDGYRKAHEELLQLQGVGPKVADCVCLMGLGWGEAVPVDTHVWQIAQRDYKFGKGKHKSLTKATYDAVGDHFRDLWGKEAGWAHSVLFTADLKSFSERLITKIEVKEEEKVMKLEENGDADIEISATADVTTEKRVKRELAEEDQKVHEAQEIVAKRRVKRRRKA